MDFIGHFGDKVPMPTVKREIRFMRDASYGVSSHFQQLPQNLRRKGMELRSMATTAWLSPLEGSGYSASNFAGAALSGRALARAALGREFPISALSIAERVPSPTIAHVSSRPP